MKKNIVRILSLLLTALMIFAVIPGGAMAAEGVETTVSAEYKTDEAGSAYGTYTVTSSVSGTYSLFWGDENGEKLTLTMNDLTAPYSNFAEIAVSKGTGSKTINSFTAIPDGAEKILAYKGDELCAETDIPDNKIADNGDMLYSFGTLSDVHFNRYDAVSDDDAEIAFPNALNFFDEAGVSLVAMAGDLSKNGEKSAYEKIYKYTSQHDYPVFSCKGNHDCHTQYRYENWAQYINTGVYGEDKLPGVVEVADNGLDFVYTDESTTDGDVFIFFSQVYRMYIVPGSRLVTDDQLDWLETQLEKYKDRTVYLYFHTFMSKSIDTSDAASFFSSLTTVLDGEGNLKNDLGLYYPLVYTIGSKDEVRFRSLLEEYKNVIWFNGHSHWSYSLQDRNNDLNISDNNGTTATMVHISSCSAPRTPSFPVWTSNSGTMSEGGMVAVYENNVIVYDIDLLNREILAYATYTIDR